MQQFYPGSKTIQIARCTEKTIMSIRYHIRYPADPGSHNRNTQRHGFHQHNRYPFNP